MRNAYSYLGSLILTVGTATGLDSLIQENSTSNINPVQRQIYQEISPQEARIQRRAGGLWVATGLIFLGIGFSEEKYK